MEKAAEFLLWLVVVVGVIAVGACVVILALIVAMMLGGCR